jgi:LysM repeat protein
MPTHYELVSRLLRKEKDIRPLYSQLLNSVEGASQKRLARTLRNLQARQLNLLNRLEDQIEDELPTPPEERRYAQHVLQQGETLQVLAQEYNIPLSRIRQYNPNLPENPSPGTVITLPIEIPDPPENYFNYYVRRGDTLFNIARRYNTDVETITRLNNISDPDVIFPGRILIIPY